MLKTTIHYQKMFPSDFETKLSENPTAYLPLGALEWHGYHNVLGLDAIKASKILEIVAEQNGGILFPPLYIGYSLFPNRKFSEFPKERYDCYSISSENYQGILEDYFQHMIKIGFQKIVVLAGHYPNKEIAENASIKFHDKKVHFVIGIEPDFVKNEKGDHAGKWETSLMMALCPEYVDLNRMNDKNDRLDGVFGIDPVESSKEYGLEMAKKIVNEIIKQTKKI